ncbi:hypothetical protein DTO207G8_3842 [Paecilomyces variotii]|nr:hypothetical protein DTO207G8_3842 [Paecilomyces variotii]KAJ9264523.1 hypothetical protein DTO195F2_2340 [Paecilomyces variotii]KAJ9366868.1 hypothetical protein DTO282E5_8424 [Paecilomyces variotii]
MRKIEGDLYRKTPRSDQQQEPPAPGNPGAPLLNHMTARRELRSSSPERQRSHFSPSEEPPRFLYPDVQAYDPTAVSSTTAAYSSPSPHWSSHGQYAVTATSLGSGHPDYSAYQGAWPAMPSTSVGSSHNTSVAPRRNSHEAWSPYWNPYISPLSHDGRRRSSDPREKAQSSSLLSSSPTSTNSTTSHSSARSPSRGGRSISGVPAGFEQILHPLPPAPASFATSPSPKAKTPMSRFRLHIRQQPIAARACGAGDKDRRSIDPPPIVQMLLADFDPSSESDMELLRDPRFTVGCLLYSVTRSSSHGGAHSEEWEERIHRSQIVEPFRLNEAAGMGGNPSGQPQGRSVQVLSGKLFVSPFFVEEDPDPETAPMYPTSTGGQKIGSSTQPLPAAFFIFTDLSVRTAGLYRLKFRLMNWGFIEETGESMPILTEVWSDTFRVHPAKDFPGMRESSRITEQLKALGVGDLKTRSKGKGKGQGR